jgi:hypothetical protein
MKDVTQILRSIALFACLSSVIVLACRAHVSTPSREGAIKTEPIPQSTPSANRTDPTCCDDAANSFVKEAWARFVKDGKYRMVQTSDMSDPEAMSRRPFAYAWGDLGYDKHPSQSYHLAVIVIDPTRDRATAYGVVIFSAPRNGDGSYRPYWLMRDRDLSNAFFSGYSGYLELIDQKNRSNMCDIHWDSRLNKYSCKGSK